jgi:tetratricopeptide (TPR) repeat protein
MKILATVSAAILALTVCPLRAAAQTPTELAQGATGMSPLDYYELSLEARSLFDARNYAAAAAAFGRLTKSYPLNGETWHWLGRALYENGQYKEAARSFVRAYELGTLVQAGLNTAGHAALAYAKANEPEPALDWLERAILEHNYSGVEYSLRLLQDDAFAALRQNPRFQKLLTPTVAASASRAEGWAADLDYLLAQIRRFNPQYNRPQVRDRIETAAARLRERIPRLGDIEVAVELQKIAALLTTSHTEVFLHRQPRRFNFPEPLPVNLWFFSDGVYVVEADGEYKSLIGSRLTAINDTPVAEAVEKLMPLVPSEGEPTRLIMTRFLILPHVLQAVGVAREADRVKLSVTGRDNKPRTVEVASKPNHQWRDSLPPPAAAGAPAPLYMTRTDEQYWFEPLPKERAVYVRVTMMRDQPSETMAAFGLRLRQFLDKQQDFKNLILDVRGNTGGNTVFYTELLRTIIAFDARPGNRVYALTDRAVFSAATNFTVDLDRLTDAIFVGEPGGGQPRMNSDAMFFNLPYSGLLVIISNVVWNLSGPYDTRRWIAPDVPVTLSAADYFANRDPALDAVRELIRKRSPE